MIHFDEVPKTNSDDQAEARRKQPYWQEIPCPDWCIEKKDGHDAEEGGEDRVHLGGPGELVTLITEDAKTFDGSRAYPVSAEVGLIQGYREIAPRVSLFFNHHQSQSVHLTLDEARDLADLLVRTARLAETPRKAPRLLRSAS